eukprot:366212-Chlamydomonas_euryale.AAC.34
MPDKPVTGPRHASYAMPCLPMPTLPCFHLPPHMLTGMSPTLASQLLLEACHAVHALAGVLALALDGQILGNELVLLRCQLLAPEEVVSEDTD